MTEEINTHDLFIQFGKYDGQRVTRVPYSYLKWAISNEVAAPVTTRDGDRPFHEVAAAEIKRRGERMQSIDITSHAVDKLSLRHLKKWKADRGNDEGLYSWAQRRAMEAWNARTVADQRDDEVWEIKHFDIKWVIEDQAIPVVKTVK